MRALSFGRIFSFGALLALGLMLCPGCEPGAKPGPAQVDPASTQAQPGQAQPAKAAAGAKAADPAIPAGHPTAMPAGHASVTPTGHAGKGRAPSTVTGKVLETMSASGYAYVRLATGAGEVWVAGPEGEFAVGDVVTAGGTSEMKNFPSKALDRTFESILFASSLVKGAGRGGAAAAQLGPRAAPAPAAGGVEVKAVSKAAGEGGRTVAEVHGDSAGLAGKEVTVHGTVVKFNGGIMGRNWLHLQDATGDAGAGTNDLTVTTDDVAKRGDVVTVTGKVVVGKDFGAGYKYDVLLEEAKVTVE